MLFHLDALAEETGRPLRLKYPLRYLHAISTPARLTAYLDDISFVGWIASRSPQTTFAFARELLSYCDDSDIVARRGLYTFSPEWKQSLLQWFQRSQDPGTGF